MKTRYRLNVGLTIGISSDESPDSTADAVGQYVDEALHRISSGGFGSHHDVSHKVEHAAVTGSRELDPEPESDREYAAETIKQLVDVQQRMGTLNVTRSVESIGETIEHLLAEHGWMLCRECGKLTDDREDTDGRCPACVTPDDVHLVVADGPTVGTTWCYRTDGRQTRFPVDATCTECIDRYREHA